MMMMRKPFANKLCMPLNTDAAKPMTLPGSKYSANGLSAMLMLRWPNQPRRPAVISRRRS